jgi:hypothetical protein
MRALHPQGAAGFVDPVVDRDDLALEPSRPAARWRLRRPLSDGHARGKALGHERTRSESALRSSMLAISV